jgi:hypothetical protein
MLTGILAIKLIENGAILAMIVFLIWRLILMNDETPNSTPDNSVDVDNAMNDRLNRLGGEVAPVITPEEFARLQKAGQVHIDARGRVRTERPRGVDPGVSLRKRRAWYGDGLGRKGEYARN